MSSSDNFYKLAVLAIFVLVAIQIVNFFYENPIVIETTEHMNPALLTHQYENLAQKPGDKSVMDFYYRGDRYSSEFKWSPTLVDPLSVDRGIKCGPSYDWDVKLIPGANNVYGDVLWHQTSPRMILDSNCMSCNNNKKLYNAPKGVHINN